MSVSAATTSGRTPRLWVCNGTICRVWLSAGRWIGPPADSEMPVDPVGVATASPLPSYWPTYSPSANTSSRVTFRSNGFSGGTCSSITSLIPIASTPSASTWSIWRLSTVARPRTTSERASSRSDRSTRARKESVPAFTPSCGIPRAVNRLMPSRNVPSPPTVSPSVDCPSRWTASTDSSSVTLATSMSRPSAHARRRSVGSWASGLHSAMIRSVVASRLPCILRVLGRRRA